VGIKETLELNQPHIFATDVKGDIKFEDSVVFAVKSNLEKQKLMEMAFKLAPIVAQMDLSDPNCVEY